jgi:hypothetical protein
MNKNNLILLSLIIGLLSITLVSALDFTPKADINMQNYSIKNANNVSSTWFYGKLNWSWLQNVPSYVKDWSSDITGNYSELDNSKLDKTDQRYNDTNNNVNSSTFWVGMNGLASPWIIKTSVLLDFNATKLNNTIIQKTAIADLHTHALNNLTSGNMTVNLNINKYNITQSNSSGSIKWNTYVSPSGALVTEYVP